MAQYLSLHLVDYFEHLVQTDTNSYFICIDGLRTLFFDKIYQKYPDRVFCVGIAEQNAMGIAAGLALSGKNVYVVGLPVYEVCRAYEQLKLDICYNNANVKIIGYMTGLSLFSGGYSHWNTEDVALLNDLPNIEIVSPSSIEELDYYLKYYEKNKGPVYFRIDALKSFDGFPLPKNNTKYNKVSELRKGKDVAIIATGASVLNSIKIYNELEQRGNSVGMYSVHTLKPFDEEGVLNVCKHYKTVITMEEHSKTGSMYSMLIETLWKNNIKTKVLPLYVSPKEFAVTGTYEYAIENMFNMTQDEIVKKAGAPILYRLGVFKNKIKVFNNNNRKIKKCFCGIPYMKIIDSTECKKYFLFGFLPIRKIVY